MSTRGAPRRQTLHVRLNRGDTFFRTGSTLGSCSGAPDRTLCRMNDTVRPYLDGLPDARRADAEALLALMRRATGETPSVARNIVGFGNYHYKYASGREGD